MKDIISICSSICDTARIHLVRSLLILPFYATVVLYKLQILPRPLISSLPALSLWRVEFKLLHLFYIYSKHFYCLK